MARKKSRSDEPVEEQHLIADSVHADTVSEGFIADLMCQLTTAWLFLTRVPLPRWWNRPAPGEGPQSAPSATDMDADLDERADGPGPDKGRKLLPLHDTVRMWPLVGLLVGAGAGVALWLGAVAGLHPLAASFLGLAVAALMTGGLHEDGLADVADGFGGGADKTKKLRIMRDSRVGAFGVLVLVLTVGFKAGVLGGFTGPGLAAVALVVAHALSRAMLPMMMVVMAPARRTGLGKAAGTPKREDAVLSAAIGVLIAVLAVGVGPGLAAGVLAALGVAGVGWLAQRHIRGFTGDVLGAAQQASEILVLAGLAVMLEAVFV